MIEDFAPPRPRAHVAPKPAIRKRLPRQETPKMVRDINAIEAMRVARKITIAHLVRVSGVSQRQYQRLRKGIGVPLTSTIERLSRALVTISQQIASTGTNAHIIDQGANYSTIVDALRARRIELKLSGEEVDGLAGFEQGYTNKLENWGKKYGRGFGEEALRAWCMALGVEIAMVRVDVPLSTLRFIERIPADQLRRRTKVR